MVVKTKVAYIDYETEMQQICTEIKELHSNSIVLDETLILKLSCSVNSLREIIFTLINNNRVNLEDFCNFSEENNKIFSKIPEEALKICFTLLEGKKGGFSEMVNGFKLLKCLLNSRKQVECFVNQMKGLDLFVSMLTDPELAQYNLLRVKVLETVFFLLSFKSVSEEMTVPFKETVKLSYKATSKRSSKENETAEIFNFYQLILFQSMISPNQKVLYLIRAILNRFSTQILLRELDFIASKPKINDYFSKVVLIILDKLVKTLLDNPFCYAKGSDLDYDPYFTADSPFKYFWNTNIHMENKYFSKFCSPEPQNAIVDGKYSSEDNVLVSNRLFELFDQTNFLENCLRIIENTAELSDETTKMILSIKNIFAFLLLSQGGIALFTRKRVVVEEIFKLNSTLSECFSDKKVLEETNLRRESNRKFEVFPAFTRPVWMDKSHLSGQIELLLFDTAAPSNKTAITVNFAQLSYLLKNSFEFMSQIDHLHFVFKAEVPDPDEILQTLIYLSENMDKTQLGKQSLVSILNNTFGSAIFLRMLDYFLENDVKTFEPHLALVVELLFSAFSDLSKEGDSLLFCHGKTFYLKIEALYRKIVSVYDEMEIDPTVNQFFARIEAFLKFLVPAATIQSDSKAVMETLNTVCYRDMQKYNFPKLPINSTSIKEEIREYCTNMKLNMLKFTHDDANFLGSARENKDFMNEVLIGFKMLDLSSRVNSVLMIDFVSAHLHLVLKYAFSNSVNALLSMLKEGDNSEAIKEASTLLFHQVNILERLLSILLSSHVEHFRDDISIDHLVKLIAGLVSFFQESPLFEREMVCETSFYLTELFKASLKTFKTLIKLNNTVKLTFERIVEQIVNLPENKAGMVWLINFVFDIVNDRYSLEIFFDFLKKKQKVFVKNIFYDCESKVKEQAVRIGSVHQNASVIEFFVANGIETNNSFLRSAVASLLLSMLRSNNDDYVHEYVGEAVRMRLRSAIERAKSVDIMLVQEKEIEFCLANLEDLLRILLLLRQLVDSDFKFLFLFDDLQTEVCRITNYLKKYVLAGGKEGSKLKIKVLDCASEALHILAVFCNPYSTNRVNKEKRISYEEIVENTPDSSSWIKITDTAVAFLEAAADRNIDVSRLIVPCLTVLTHSLSHFSGHRVVLRDNAPSLPRLLESVKILLKSNQTEGESALKLFVRLIYLLSYDLEWYQSKKETVSKKAFATNEKLKTRISSIHETKVGIFLGFKGSLSKYCKTVAQELDSLASKQVKPLLLRLRDIAVEVTEVSRISSYKLPLPREISVIMREVKLNKQLVQSKAHPRYFNRSDEEREALISEYDKLLNWKKYRIFYEKLSHIEPREANLNFDLSSTNLREFDPRTDDIFDSHSMRQRLSYTSKKPEYHFAANIAAETVITERTALVRTAIALAIPTPELTLYTETFDSMQESLTENILKDSVKRSIKSKINQYIYKPKYEQHQLLVRNTAIQPQNDNKPSSIREAKGNSVVSGRLLSVHVDKFDNTGGVVSTVYNEKNMPSPNARAESVAEQSNSASSSKVESAASSINKLQDLLRQVKKDTKTSERVDPRMRRKR